MNCRHRKLFSPAEREDTAAVPHDNNRALSDADNNLSKEISLLVFATQ